MSETISNKNFKEYFFENIRWISPMVITILTLYIASLLAPLKQTIEVQAYEIQTLKEAQESFLEKGSVSAQVTAERVSNVEKSLVEIKETLKYIDQKLDRHISE